MADFKGTILTTAGRNLLAKALTGAKLEFTKVQLGDGVWDESVNPESLTALVSPKLDLPINDLEITGDGTVRLRVLLTNTGLTEGFFTRELGIFAKDPDTGEEVLYSVAYAENPDYIPSDGVTKVENVFDVYTVIANAQSVTAVISDTVILATKQDIEEDIKEHNQNPEAHPDIREAIQTATGNLSTEIDAKIEAHNSDENILEMLYIVLFRNLAGI
jgi:phage-related tail fiber protein